MISMRDLYVRIVVALDGGEQEPIRRFEIRALQGRSAGQFEAEPEAFGVVASQRIIDSTPQGGQDLAPMFTFDGGDPMQTEVRRCPAMQAPSRSPNPVVRGRF
jgi:hypothetical protein